MQTDLNLFSLHGDYYQDNENRLTANLVFLLSEFRHSLLPPLLEHANCPPNAVRESDLACARFSFQESIQIANGLRRPDAQIAIADKVRIIIEAKVGRNPLNLQQLIEYATDLKASRATNKRLLCITQMNEHEAFDLMSRTIEPGILPEGSCVCIRWFELLDLIRNSASLDNNRRRAIRDGVYAGRRVDYQKRLSSLFLDEVERDMYDKRVLDELETKHLHDLVLSTQDAWFMRAALEFRVWFPSGGNVSPTPAKYVAYYEINDGKNLHPKQISFVARNRIWWNQLTLEDAGREHELQHALADNELRSAMGRWGVFNIVLTDNAIALARPLRLGRKSWAARVMPLRKVDLPTLMNASTIDDL